MKRKLIALAVAGAFVPAIAMADTSVTIYGTMNGAWNFIKAEGATAGVPGTATPPTATSPGLPLGVTPSGLVAGANLPSRNRVDIDSSNIGFRVKEDLGGGLNAWGQCEISMVFDSGGGSVCSRNAGVGLEGAFGNIFLGQWDSPHKQFGSIDVQGNTHIVAWVAIMHSPGLNTSSTTGGNSGLSFDKRQQNTVNYYTPNWNGFQIKGQFSADEEKTDDFVNLATGGVTPGLDPYMYSISGTYDNGPLFLGVSYENHKDYNTDPLAIGGLATDTKDWSWQAAGSYKFGNFKLAVAYDKLHYERNTLGAVSAEVERDGWYFGGSYGAGPHYFALSYAFGDDWDCSGTAVIPGGAVNPLRCDNTKGESLAARYAYSLSKRTEVFAHYIKVKNKDNAQYTFGVNSLTPVAPGADPQGFGIGVKHKF